MSPSTVILTGATGFIGQQLLYRLLTQGHRVGAVVRPRQGKTPRQRIEELIGRWEQRLEVDLPRPVCLQGDIREKNFGLRADDLAWVRRHAQVMLHNAALVTFTDQGQRELLWQTNVVGTQNCLDLCRAAGIDDLHYVSTAYVCGRRRGVIREDELDCGQGFRNEYERTKFLAEQQVRQSQVARNLTIYRPSIVIGDSRSGFTTSYRGIYALFQFTHLFAEHAQRDASGRWYHPVRVFLRADERRNLVPVDWVADVILRGLQTEAMWNQTYHVAPRQPVTVGQLEAAARDYFGFHGVEFVGPGSLDREASREEQMLYAHMAAYMPYWYDDPTFDTTRTSAVVPADSEPRVDADCLRRIIDFAVQDRFGKRRAGTVASLAGC